MTTDSRILAWRIPQTEEPSKWATVHRVSKSWTSVNTQGPHSQLPNNVREDQIYGKLLQPTVSGNYSRILKKETNFKQTNFTIAIKCL